MILYDLEEAGGVRLFERVTDTGARVGYFLPPLGMREDHWRHPKLFAFFFCHRGPDTKTQGGDVLALALALAAVVCVILS